MRRVTISLADSDRILGDLPSPLPLDRLLPGHGGWEVEIGCGKGRYLLRRAQQEPERRFLGIEVAGKYFRLVRRRMRRRALENILLLRGEALYLMAVCLPAGFADAVHVYFPDPWPKERHHQRRLFDVETVDLVVGLLHPGGTLFFATDHPDYGELVRDILESHPGVGVRTRSAGWPDGARTNYEAKYQAEGRGVLRLEGTRLVLPEGPPLHPAGIGALLAAVGPRGGAD